MFENCCISDMRNKEVINTCDGRRLGCVIDIEFNICDGRIVSIIVPGDLKVGFWGKCEGMRVPWCKIDKIGDDIILVNVGELPAGPGECCCDGKEKKKKHSFK